MLFYYFIRLKKQQKLINCRHQIYLWLRLRNLGKMEEDDKGCPMIRMGVRGWLFLLVPAYPGCHGPSAVKRLCVCVCVCVRLRNLKHLFFYLERKLSCYAADRSGGGRWPGRKCRRLAVDTRRDAGRSLRDQLWTVRGDWADWEKARWRAIGSSPNRDSIAICRRIASIAAAAVAAAAWLLVATS